MLVISLEYKRRIVELMGIFYSKYTGNEIDASVEINLVQNKRINQIEQKLATIEENANNYSLPVATSSVLGGIKSGGDITVDSNGSVTLNSGVVGASELADNAVTTAKIANGAVNVDKLAANSVTNEKIANGAVSNEKIANGTVTYAKLAQDALYSPVVWATNGAVINADHIGKTMLMSTSSDFNISFTEESLNSLPIGTEIAFYRWMDAKCTITFSGEMTVIANSKPYYPTAPISFTTKTYTTFAIKKMTSNGIVILGNVEVVT